jgi:signal transduction histidine kinase
VLPGDLPYFLQAGVNHALGRAVSIIDPHSRRRFDAFYRFDCYQQFCHKLRDGMDTKEASQDWDNNCTNCDLHVANYLIKNLPVPGNNRASFVRYRCYLGLEECATVVSVGGLQVMVVSGQFLPLTGSEDIKRVLACLGKRPPKENEVSREMWSSLAMLRFPEALWINGKEISEKDLGELYRFADELRPCEANFEDRFMKEAERIQDIAQRYYEMVKTRVEASIMQDIALSLSSADPSNSQDMWGNISSALTILNDKLGLRYCAYFSGYTESDTILHLRSGTGQLPEEFKCENAVHFNWRKAGIKTNDQRDTASQIFNWFEVGLDQLTTVTRGLKGITNPKELTTALIPVKLPKGPFGLLVLGSHNQSVDLKAHESFVLSAGRDLCTRILTLQLSNILTQDRTNWARTAQLSGHRLRASIQNIGSQLKTIRAVIHNDPAFDLQDRNSAEADLEVAFKNLTELSYSTESSIPGTLDVKSVSRDVVGLSNVIRDAVSTQQDLADQFGIEIDDSEIKDLPPVFANYTLIRSAFVNLINNGLKYSYPRPVDRKRVFRIKPSAKLLDPLEVAIEFVNYGLGVKEADKERIFEWGVRLAEADRLFREVYGKGIGLWEVRHIIEGHGGRVLVDSIHYDKAPVTDQNIKQCITVFTVVLPIAESA